MRLILTRHGKTFENDLGILQGHMDSKLNPEGFLQAEKLAKRLSKIKIDAIYTSDLSRAADTAKAIAKYHPKIKVIKLKSFREQDIGSFENKKKTEVDWKNLPPDFESSESILKRAKYTLDRLFSKHHGQTVVLVGHGGVNRAMITVIAHDKNATMQTAPDQRNTAVNIFDIREDNKHKIHLINCTRHLDEESPKKSKKYLKKKSSRR